MLTLGLPLHPSRRAVHTHTPQAARDEHSHPDPHPRPYISGVGARSPHESQEVLPPPCKAVTYVGVLESMCVVTLHASLACHGPPHATLTRRAPLPQAGRGPREPLLHTSPGYAGDTAGAGDAPKPTRRGGRVPLVGKLPAGAPHLQLCGTPASTHAPSPLRNGYAHCQCLMVRACFTSR